MQSENGSDPEAEPMIPWIDVARAGWRPAAGWVCVVGLVVLCVIYPLAQIVRAQPLDLINLLAVIAAGGGLATLRTIEKTKGD